MSQHVSTYLNMSQHVSTYLNMSQYVSICHLDVTNVSQLCVVTGSFICSTALGLFRLRPVTLKPTAPRPGTTGPRWDACHDSTRHVETSCRNVTKLEIPISKRHSKDIQNVQKSKLCNFTHMEHMGLRLWAVLFTVSCSGCFGLWMGVKQANKLLPRGTIILKTCFKEKLILSKIEQD